MKKSFELQILEALCSVGFDQTVNITELVRSFFVNDVWVDIDEQAELLLKNMSNAKYLNYGVHSEQRDEVTKKMYNASLMIEGYRHYNDFYNRELTKQLAASTIKNHRILEMVGYFTAFVSLITAVVVVLNYVAPLKSKETVQHPVQINIVQPKSSEAKITLKKPLKVALPNQKNY